MTWRPDRPFDALDPLPPRREIETRVVLKAALEARVALASLDQAARRMTNPSVLVNNLPLLEAQASSEIENIVTTADDLFRFAHDEDSARNPATKETLGYRSALFQGVALIRARPLSVTTAIEICTTIKAREMRIRSRPGTFIGNPVTHEAIYTPPVGEALIRDKLTEWERFVHDPGPIDPLVAMALAHYQFEAIHPFDDGNGGTGRILNVLQLLDAGLISDPILYLSRYIIQNKDEYYRLLLAVTRDGSWEEWVLFVLEGVRVTAASTMRKIDAIDDLQDVMLGTIRASTKAGPRADLLGVLFDQPYCRISDVVRRCGVSRPTATSWLNSLSGAGALTSIRVGRERLFINHEFVALLVSPETAPSPPPTLF